MPKMGSMAAPSGYPWLSLEQVITEQIATNGTIKLNFVLHNITDESNGNALEQVVHGIEIIHSLPPNELFSVEHMESSQGKVFLETVKLFLYRPLLLGRLDGFMIGDNILNETLKDQLQKLMPRLDSSHAYWLVGHTDDLGASRYNRELSMRRATTIKKALESSGFDPKHLTVLGRGERKLLETKRDEQSMSRNRRVEIYPAAHPLLHWQLSTLKPDEKATLEVILKPRPWADDVQVQALIKGDIFSKMALTYQKTVPTEPKLVISAQLRPEGPGFSKQWIHDTDLSHCDRLQVQVKVSNHGGMSAKRVQLVTRIPKQWQIESKGQNLKQVKLTNTRLWPQQEWIEYYQILSPLQGWQGTVKKRTEVHKISARSKGGFTSQAVTNKVNWHTPHISIHVEAPVLSHAGESILQQIRVHNDGDWPIHQPTIIGNIPPAVHSITAAGAVITDNRVTWHLNRLLPGEEQIIQLAFTPDDNKDIPKLETNFIVYDQAYGAEKSNNCVKSKAKTVTQVASLLPPKLKIVGEHNALPVGGENNYHLELFNPNPLPISYSIEGKLDPKVWQLVTSRVKASIEKEGDTAKNIHIDIDISEVGDISISNPKAVTIPANGRLNFTLTFQVNGMSTQALHAIANNLSSNFDVTELHFRAKTLHDLVSSHAAESTIIYQ